MTTKNALLWLVSLALLAGEGCGRLRDDAPRAGDGSAGGAGAAGTAGTEGVTPGSDGGDGGAAVQSPAGGADQAGAGGSGGAAANTPNCLALADCCANVAKAGHPTCSDAALHAPDEQCAYSLAMNESALLCTGPGESTVACLQTSGSATDCTLWLTGAATKASREDDCTGNGGTVIDECPAAGITGCCDYGGVERCGYDHDLTPQGCQALGGSYSDTLIPLLPP